MKSIVIGLTGPIASGKNTVAMMFSRHGAFVIDADKVGHQVIAPQTKAWHEIIKAFGSKVLNRGGTVNRRKLSTIVFSNPNALRTLNKIAHPEMRRIIRGKINEAKLAGKKIIVINAAVLEEMKLLSLTDKVLVVLAGKSARVSRMLRSGFSMQEALARIRVQGSDSKYRKIADLLIENNGKICDLKEKVKRIVQLIKPETRH
jgi:dephospho-CoA kinase